MSTRLLFDDFVKTAIKKPTKMKMLKMHSYDIKEEIEICKKLCKVLVPSISNNQVIEGVPVLTWEEHKALKSKNKK